MAVPCPRRRSGVTLEGLCQHCQRQIDRYLDESSWVRDEANRLDWDMLTSEDEDTQQFPA